MQINAMNAHERDAASIGAYAMTVSGVRAFLGSTGGLVLTVLAAAVGLYLLTFHTTHVLLLLPYVALLACPLMHLMHRGHHGHPPAPSSDADRVDRHSDAAASRQKSIGKVRASF